jgi:hypothetical protein
VDLGFGSHVWAAIHAQLGAEIDRACERALAKLPLD